MSVEGGPIITTLDYMMRVSRTYSLSIRSQEEGERLACVVLEPIIGNAGSISARQVGVGEESSFFMLAFYGVGW
jgi:hypothetical protein